MPSEPMTVGELRQQLEGLKDSDTLHLPGGLSFYRLKRWSDDEYLLEVNEPQAYLSKEFKQKNPHLKVAFISVEEVEWDEEGIVGGPVDVEIT